MSAEFLLRNFSIQKLFRNFLSTLIWKDLKFQFMQIKLWVFKFVWQESCDLNQI